ncbi:MAG: DPP IV N-terminal domain-containing protein [Bacteroidales bacterium]
MIRYLSIIIFGLLFSTTGVTQDKQLTLEDAVYLNPGVLPKRLNQLMWMGENDNYSYVKDNQLMTGRASSSESRVSATLDDLNAGLADLNMDSIKRFPRIHHLPEHTFWFLHQNKLFKYSITTRNLEQKNEYPKEAENLEVDENAFNIAYTLENNLYVNVGGKQSQITEDTVNGIVNGQTVHRNEFGINKGIFWSPNGNYIAYYRKDETMVTDYPLVDIETRIATVENTKYPMAGMESEQVTLRIFNISTGKKIFINTGEPKDQYLTSVTWDPSEEFIYIGILNRDQNHLKLNKYSAITGELIKTLFEEKNPNYVEPEHPLYFRETNPSQFFWFSERDGFQHLYLFNSEGELIQQVTKGDWVVTDFLGEDKRGRTVFFASTKESPIQEQLYSTDLKTGTVTRLSPDHGTHNGILSPSGDYVFDIYSSTDVASEYRIVDRNGKVTDVLLENENPLKDYSLGEMEIITMKADDGTDLYGRIIKPSDFDPSRKYPVFYYVYGGPHSQLVSDSWLGAAGIFQNYMAQQGYVVFTMDNRGTANRGLEFEQSIFRNLGQLEIADQMKGVEYLKTLNYVDQERMGIDGWSYGGFLTISMILQHPEVFKVACAGGPVIDWKYYEVMYGERYMDTPESNPEGYEKANLSNYVDKLDAKLLIIQGTKDPTVVWQNSLTFLKKCVDEGRQVDYFVYPGHGHNVRGKDRVHLYEKIRRYFDENLKN